MNKQAITFKYDSFMDRYSATEKATGNKYLIAPKISGQIHTYCNGELVDDRARSVREAKRNVKEAAA